MFDSLDNIGNLVCPAEFNTGAHKSIMLLSVPAKTGEGMDELVAWFDKEIRNIKK